MYNVKKKKINFAEGVYYFNVYTQNYPVTIHRKKKSNAMKAFKRYNSSGKSCEWLGKWNGKKFEETDLFAQKSESK